MGIETWALLALVAVLAVYLLPFLVRRREAMGMANAEDRYSAGLRLLATGDAAAPEGGCGGGHAMIFRRRPEVRAMNRPEVRNVRALRKERELVRVRAAHERNRERRRVAASHRATVALVLAGVTLGTLVIAGVTVMPWWPVVIPAALLCLSATAGHRAARASAATDLRERRRIAALERELTALTGGSGGRRLVENASAPAAGAAQVKAEEPTDVSRGGHTQFTHEGGAEADAAAAVVTPVAAEPTEAAERGDLVEAGDDGEVGAPASAAAAVVESAVVESAAGEVDRSEESSTDAGAAPVGSGGGTSEADVAMTAVEAVTGAEVRGRAAADAARTVKPGVKADVKAPATPPQGWHPVSVPAPTYTLAARAPRRSYEPPAEQAFDSAPVPERPRNLRTYPTADLGVEADEPVFHPIDLEAVLERRRAGA
ncbi:hypothetical protein [Actinomyces procaprae]|uniref:hypothetical protein n=1 Tax=Actinomyces procaprae TaxID=2560010 RepID=UPI0010A22ECA|nr:hypothetical protein [Actinomyces procaprae]